MAVPIPVPISPLPATNLDVSRAEQLVSLLVQVIARGSEGAATNTAPTFTQGSVNGASSPLELATPEQQIFYRQLAVALTVWLATPPPSPAPSPSFSFSGTCLSSAQLGDVVYMNGPLNDVRGVDLTDFNKMPVVGSIVEKPTPTTCVVQTSNILSGIYTGLTPGKIYYAGIGANPKPVYPAPIPGAAETIFIQPIGIAVNSTTIALCPSVNLTKVKGSSV